MKHIECCVARDLLPLYIDNACSEQTAQLVATHLHSCDACKKIYSEITSDICSVLPKPEFESKAIFRNIYQHLIGIIFALALMISCFIINTDSALEGSSVEVKHFITTTIYLVFWSVFSLLSKNYKPLINVSFIVSLLTFISSINGLVWNILEQSGSISSFISIFTTIPFYGLRLFFGWTQLYLFASIFSLCCLLYTGVHFRKLEKSLNTKKQS